MKEVHIVSWVDHNDPARTHVLGCYLKLEDAIEYASDTAANAPARFAKVHEREWTNHTSIEIESFYLND